MKMMIIIEGILTRKNKPFFSVTSLYGIIQIIFYYISQFKRKKEADVVINMCAQFFKSFLLNTCFSKSLFIALPNEPSANEFKLHKTINLMSYIIKLI